MIMEQFKIGDRVKRKFGFKSKHNIGTVIGNLGIGTTVKWDDGAKERVQNPTLTKIIKQQSK